MPEQTPRATRINLWTIVAVGIVFIIAAILGSGAAAVLSLVTPERMWVSWTWLAVVPLWLLVSEIVLPLAVEFLGGSISVFVRTGVIVLLSAGFLAVWFSHRLP